MSATAIKINNLTKTYQEIPAVKNLSFEIKFGAITALLGSNGAGKSTTLDMMAGILKPTSGTIEINGLHYQDHEREIKKNLAYLTSHMNLYDKLTVEESLKFLGGLKGLTNKDLKVRIEELSALFSLSTILKKTFSSLSSGQKQRSLVAASIIHDPQILIFDEVTASLDLVVAKEIMDFLKQEKERGKAIIFSTHIPSEVEYLSDRILLLERGQLVKDTSYQEFMSKTQATNLTDAFYDVLKGLERE